MRSLIPFVAVVSLAAPLAAAPVLGPMATLKQKNGEFDKLLRGKPAAGTPAE